LRAAALSAAVLAALSCSKTSDTAPERRVFGDPPTIQSVDYVFNAASSVTCDISVLVANIICDQSGKTVFDVEFLTGSGWNTKEVNGHQEVFFAPAPSPGPGVFIQGTYSEAIFRAKVTDPQSVPNGKTDVLLVSSSFEQPESKSETSLVLFDDGSSNLFPNPQRLGLPEKCSLDPVNQVCQCDPATFDVVSGDETPNDGWFVRHFAIPNRTTSGFLLDCIMRAHQENVAFPAPPGTPFQFQIEAVDREGNLTKWPTKLNGTTGTDTFVCNGDPCACCYLYSASGQGVDQSQCRGTDGRGLDGMISPSLFPDGFCHFLNG
jgi:hypothetical protein